MTVAEFQQGLRERMGRRPFVPFEVELATGQRIRIGKEWSVSAREGYATYLERNPRLSFVDFDFKNTAAFLDVEIAVVAPIV